MRSRLRAARNSTQRGWLTSIAISRRSQFSRLNCTPPVHVVNESGDINLSCSEVASVFGRGGVNLSRRAISYDFDMDAERPHKN